MGSEATADKMAASGNSNSSSSSNVEEEEQQQQQEQGEQQQLLHQEQQEKEEQPASSSSPRATSLPLDGSVVKMKVRATIPCIGAGLYGAQQRGLWRLKVSKRSRRTPSSSSSPSPLQKQGLPFKATAADVVTFFEGFSLKGGAGSVYLKRHLDGRMNGEVGAQQPPPPAPICAAHALAKSSRCVALLLLCARADQSAKTAPFC